MRIFSFILVIVNFITIKFLFSHGKYEYMGKEIKDGVPKVNHPNMQLYTNAIALKSN